MLYKKFFYNNSRILIWKIEENIEELKFLVFNFLTDKEKRRFLDFKNEKRQKEFLCTRYLIKLASNLDKIEVLYDKYGKPFLDSFKISISHTDNFAAIIISENNEVAIDIQIVTERTILIKDKFLSENELKNFKTDCFKTVSLLWSLKETIYKLYGKKTVDFKKDIKIEPFDYEKTNKVKIILKDNVEVITEFDFFENVCLTYSQSE